MLTSDQLEAREAWIQKLETNDLIQVRHCLVEGDPHNPEDESRVGYCCLGVAEYCAGNRAVWRDLWTEGPTELSGWSIGGVDGTMSMSTAESMGFVTRNPFLWVIPESLNPLMETNGYSLGDVGLTTLNDSFGLSFPEIAAVIRAQPVDWDGSDPTNSPFEF